MSAETCLIHGIVKVYDMRSGFELCEECERDSERRHAERRQGPRERRQREQLSRYMRRLGVSDRRTAERRHN